MRLVPPVCITGAVLSSFVVVGRFAVRCAAAAFSASRRCSSTERPRLRCLALAAGLHIGSRAIAVVVLSVLVMLLWLLWLRVVSLCLALRTLNRAAL